MTLRQPSSYRQLYAWWEASCRDSRHGVVEGEAHCGWYKVRMVRGGPWVPVRIYVEREIDPATGELLNPEILCKEIAGRPGGDPAYRFGELKAISREEYDSLMEAHAFSPVMQATHVAKPDLTITPARP